MKYFYNKNFFFSFYLGLEDAVESSYYADYGNIRMYDCIQFWIKKRWTHQRYIRAYIVIDPLLCITSIWCMQDDDNMPII